MQKKQALEKVGQPTPAMSRDDVMMMLGAARYAEWNSSISASHVMQFLMTVEDRKLYIPAGYKTFVEFLDRSGLKSKSTYYRHRELLLKEGSDVFDLMEDLGIPAHVRHQIEAGDVRVVGNDVFIGDQEFDKGENPTITKQVIVQLVKDKIAAEKESARLKNIEHKYTALRAEVDDDNDKPPYVTAYLNTVEAVLTFINEVDDLPGEMKAARAVGDLDHVSELLDQLYRAYGESFPYPRRRAAVGGKQ